FVVYGFIISAMHRFDAIPNYILLTLAGVVTSVIAQLGDLSASAIKRNYGVKDFGSIFPGHGGILDRVDSVLAVAPVIMLIGAIFLKVNAYGLFT
ncbi:MAG: phosphatidate cytidylyltransferase, partial [Oscillospiraceae bacterium]|nr:phosphatidate cytidylyltransferase [Oscillospiraceae bacterium]